MRDYYMPETPITDAVVVTNADRIRAMSDELLATQLVKVVEETIKVLTGLDVPYELLNEIRSNLLEKLKQPAETENVDHCVCCGAIIPEGQIVCPNCLVTVNERR